MDMSKIDAFMVARETNRIQTDNYIILSAEELQEIQSKAWDEGYESGYQDGSQE